MLLNIKKELKIKMTSKTMNLKFNGCDIDFIENICRASCCESSVSKSGTLITVHPSEVQELLNKGAKIENNLLQPVNKRCPFKMVNNLCSLHNTPAKPKGCIISPFTINKNNTLIVRNRYKLLKCYNTGNKLPVYKAFKESLVLMFGEEGYDKILRSFEFGCIEIYLPIKKDIYDLIVDNDKIKKEFKNVN